MSPRLLAAAALALGLLGLAGCGASPPAATSPTAAGPSGGFTLLYSGNLDGEIEPCG